MEVLLILIGSNSEYACKGLYDKVQLYSILIVTNVMSKFAALISHS